MKSLNNCCYSWYSWDFKYSKQFYQIVWHSNKKIYPNAMFAMLLCTTNSENALNSVGWFYCFGIHRMHLNWVFIVCRIASQHYYPKTIILTGIIFREAIITFVSSQQKPTFNPYNTHLLHSHRQQKPRFCKCTRFSTAIVPTMEQIATKTPQQHARGWKQTIER